MLYKILLLSYASVMVSGCVGGGSDPTIPVTVDPVIVTPVAITTGFSGQADANGGGLITSYNPSANQLTNRVIGYVDNVAAAREIYDGNLTVWNYSNHSNDGTYYSYTATATTTNNHSLEFISNFLGLDNQRTEVVERIYAIIDNDRDNLAYVISGTAPTTLPLGTQVYVGKMEFADGRNSGLNYEIGDMTMNVNFTNKTATVTAQSTSYFANGGSITIDPAQATFTSSNAVLGDRNTSGTSASVAGGFYGTQGNGVGGVVLPNSFFEMTAGFIGKTQ